MTDFKPMLAAAADLDDILALRGDFIVSPKVDGIRCICHPTLGPVTRSLKLIPNDHIRIFLCAPEFRGLDGELVVGDLTAPDVFNKSTSGVMTKSGTPNFTYHVFDWMHEPEKAYSIRLSNAENMLAQFTEEASRNKSFSRVEMLNYEEIEGRDGWEITNIWEPQFLEEGFEGIIIRDRLGIYKHGRSTLKQKGMIKFKRMEDAEAEVIGFTALERNQNAPTRDLLGHTQRSDHKAGKVADNLLGVLQVRHRTFGEFGIGSGFDTSWREEIWQNQEKFLGKTVTFKYQKIGVVDKPRFPIFKGFRDPIDL